MREEVAGGQIFIPHAKAVTGGRIGRAITHWAPELANQKNSSIVATYHTMSLNPFQSICTKRHSNDNPTEKWYSYVQILLPLCPHTFSLKSLRETFRYISRLYVFL
jgi:hypothetical protein